MIKKDSSVRIEVTLDAEYGSFADQYGIDPAQQFPEVLKYILCADVDGQDPAIVLLELAQKGIEKEKQHAENA